MLKRKALSDARFRRYAELAGLADADHARGKIEHVWAECDERGTHTLPARTVETILGTGGAKRLVESDLAHVTSESLDVAGQSLVDAGASLVIRGAREQFERQERRSKAAELAGKHRAATARRIGGRFTSESLVNAGASLEVPSGSGISDQGSQSGISDPPEPSSGSDRRSKGAKKAFPMPADWQPDESVRRIARERGLDLDGEIAAMRDWGAANPAKAKKADWQAFARNWMRSQNRRGGYRPATSNPVQVALAELDRLRAEEKP